MSESPKKLFLLDAFALIYRAYFAFARNPRINSKGFNTSAVFGFVNTLREVLNKEKPTHIAVVFDPSEKKSSRHDVFPEYKANREAMPEDISLSLPWIKKLIEAYNIPSITVEGYEADDVIGTLSVMAEKAGFETYMMTPDKDYGQLITEKVFMYRPSRGGNGAEVWGIPEICERFEIERPEQVIDILGLMGDAVDNIPGVPGVGEKTAKKLIAQYGSVEELLKNTSDIKGKLREKIENNTEQAMLSKQLATIMLDVPVELDEEDLVIQEPNKEALKEIFTELEFRRMAEQILGETIAAPSKPDSSGQIDLFSQGVELPGGGEVEAAALKTLEDVPHEYHFTDTPEKRAALLKELAAQKSFCFDTETTGLDPRLAELVGISFSWKRGEAYYVPLPEDMEDARTIVHEFKALLENEGVEKVGQNIKYDISMLKRYEVSVDGPIFDTMLAHYLIEPDMNRRNMDILAETYLNYTPVSITELIGKKGKNQKSMRDVPPEELNNYACEDADITLQLKELFAPILDKTNTRKLFDEVETPLIKVLADVEGNGIRLDAKNLEAYSKQLLIESREVEQHIYELAGMEFKISSPKQVGEVLFDRLKITDKPKKTKTGQYATGEDVLQNLRNDHEIIPKILEYREVQKLRNTYVDPLPTYINPNTHRLHTSYNQVVAATGRLSSDRPNLQNIPIRTERGRKIREAFIPRDDQHVLLAADYSQIELRIIAELSQDPEMLKAFREGVDIHTNTAAVVYDVPLEEVTKDMRRNAKAVNFGIVYGTTAFGLSQNLGIARKEAATIIDGYFEQYAKVKEYMENNKEYAREHGYVETILGRRRYLRDINSRNQVVRGHAERNAINAPIQGSAADMIKIAMINIHKAFRKEGFASKMVLQVHDELVFDAAKEEVDQISPVIRDLMKNAIPMSVPIEVEIDTGTNWLQAH